MSKSKVVKESKPKRATPQKDKVQKSHQFALDVNEEGISRFTIKTVYSDGFRPGTTHFYLPPEEISALRIAVMGINTDKCDNCPELIELRKLRDQPCECKQGEAIPTLFEAELGLAARVAKLEDMMGMDIPGTLVVYGKVLDAHKDELKMLNNYAKSVAVSMDTFMSEQLNRNKTQDANIKLLVEAAQEEYKKIHEELDWCTKTAEEQKFSTEKVKELHDRINALGQEDKITKTRVDELNLIVTRFQNWIHGFGK